MLLIVLNDVEVGCAVKGRDAPAVPPSLLVSQTPVLYESDNYSGGTAMKGFFHTVTDRKTCNHLQMRAVITI